MVKLVSEIIGVSPAQIIVTVMGRVTSTLPYVTRASNRHWSSPTFVTLAISYRSGFPGRSSRPAVVNRPTSATLGHPLCEPPLEVGQ